MLGSPWGTLCFCFPKNSISEAGPSSWTPSYDSFLLFNLELIPAGMTDTSPNMEWVAEALAVLVRVLSQARVIWEGEPQ